MNKLPIDQILEGSNARAGLESVLSLPEITNQTKIAIEKYLSLSQMDLGMEICIVCAAARAALILKPDAPISVQDFFEKTFPYHGAVATDPRTQTNYASGFQVFVNNEQGNPYITHPAILFYLNRYGIFGDTLANLFDLEKMRVYKDKTNSHKRFLVSLKNNFILDHSVSPEYRIGDRGIKINMDKEEIERKLNEGTHMVEIEFIGEGKISIYDPFRYPPTELEEQHRQTMEQNELQKYLTGRWIVLSDNEEILKDDDMEFPDDLGKGFGRSFPKN